ncbi:hypothetical protein QYE76_018242 [Lolium multiflorum]|uniref:Uncharacterized protein n=1 Tax=Lolium multiflorum TaxID=4521 RepID=A0AAD8PP45_LOLMU|nr:hypothetical protein QYE76_018242 [Lolium multiflorum]
MAAVTPFDYLPCFSSRLAGMVAAVMMAMTLPESFSKSIGFIFATTKEGSVLDYKPSIVAAAAARTPARHPHSQLGILYSKCPRRMRLAALSRRLRPRHGGQHALHGGRHQASRARHGAAPQQASSARGAPRARWRGPRAPHSLSKATVVVVGAGPGGAGAPGMRMNAISPHTIATPLLVRPLANSDVGETQADGGEGMSKLQGAVLEPEDMARAARLPRVRRWQIGKLINVRPAS